MSERATREWSTSPQMATVRPSTRPKERRIESASSRAWVGCSCWPSPALTTQQPTFCASSVGAPEAPRLQLARKFGAEATVNIEECRTADERIKRVRDIVGGFGADLVMDCSGHPSAGPEGIEFLRDGGTYVEMGQFTDAGSITTSWHRFCAKDVNLLGSWGFTGNDLPLGVDMLYRARAKYPWLDMQTLYPFSEEGIGRAVADAIAMKTVKSTIVPWPELVE